MKRRSFLKGIAGIAGLGLSGIVKADQKPKREEIIEIPRCTTNRNETGLNDVSNGIRIDIYNKRIMLLYPKTGKTIYRYINMYLDEHLSISPFCYMLTPTIMRLENDWTLYGLENLRDCSISNKTFNSICIKSVDNSMGYETGELKYTFDKKHYKKFKQTWGVDGINENIILPNKKKITMYIESIVSFPINRPFKIETQQPNNAGVHYMLQPTLKSTPNLKYVLR